jgi:hypothetical protein
LYEEDLDSGSSGGSFYPLRTNRYGQQKAEKTYRNQLQQIFKNINEEGEEDRNLMLEIMD